MGFWAIFVKELKELLRAAGLLFFIVYMFTVEIYVAASGINMDAKNIAVGVVDYSPGVVSTKLLSSLRLPEYRAFAGCNGGFSGVFCIFVSPKHSKRHGKQKYQRGFPRR